MKRQSILRILAGAALGAALRLGAADTGSATDFADMTVEQLLGVTVTSVSKKDTTVADSAAAVSVVTADDIRLMGAQTLPDALRWVPGMDVAQVDSDDWAVSARGSMGQYADKLLVMVDGRSIYDLDIGGVNWGVQHLVMDDIDHIEVIRGPGATLWGADAVNGVVNVITKSSAETQGAMVSAGDGTEGSWVAARYGGQIGQPTSFRVDFQHVDLTGLDDSTGGRAPDGGYDNRADLRVDSNLPGGGNFLFEAGAERSVHETVYDVGEYVPPYGLSVDESHVTDQEDATARWTSAPEVGATLQVSYTRVSIDDGMGVDEGERTFSADFQDHLHLGDRNDIVGGVGYKLTDYSVSPQPYITVVPASGSLGLPTAFVQDEVTIDPGVLTVTGGTKVEHNYYTGVEVQPSARALWTPAPDVTVWSAVSRAVRTPNLFERSDGPIDTADVLPPGAAGLPVAIDFAGNPRVQSEDLIAYELGYREVFRNRVSIDVALFDNRYGDLISYVPGAATYVAAPIPHLLLPYTAFNQSGGSDYGAEVSIDWTVVDGWRLAGDVTQSHSTFLVDPTLEANPSRQFRLRSFWKLPDNVELTAAVATMSELPNLGISGYVSVDVGVCWRPRRDFEFGLWGRNLTDPHHPEFIGQNSPLEMEVPRGVDCSATWRY